MRGDGNQARSRAGYDRPAGDAYQSRSVVLSTHGMVATSHPLAAQAGLDILRAGGSAVDAAIAANAMLGVVEPMSCGIGGDLFAICFDADSQQLHGLNASGRSPQQLQPEWFADQQISEIPEKGPLSWSVPGCVEGWGQLHSRFGRVNWGELLEPSIQTAMDGFPVTEIIQADWVRATPGLAQWEHSVATFLPHGRPPRVGEVFQNPNLARSLQTLAEEGSAAFYAGRMAAEFDRFSRQHEGWIRADDLAACRSDWVSPVSTNYRGYDVWQLPPNGQGLAVLQMLNLLEPFPFDSIAAGSADHLHLLIEAKKLAYADRAAFYADPDMADVPVSELISKAYADQRRGLMDQGQAATEVGAGDPRLVEGDTVYVTAVDQDRNGCSLIQSNFHSFGSMLTAGELGFAIQNRGSLFTLDAAHPNAYRPGKRPFNTIIPGFVTRSGKPWFSFGVMGGDMQPQGQVQVLMNLIDFGDNVQQAGDAARVRHFGSATPTGQPMQAGGGQVACESRVAESVILELEQRGHRIDRGAASGSFGGYQGILIDVAGGVLQGATDPRKDGAVAAY